MAFTLQHQNNIVVDFNIFQQLKKSGPGAPSNFPQINPSLSMAPMAPLAPSIRLMCNFVVLRHKIRTETYKLTGMTALSQLLAAIGGVASLVKILISFVLRPYQEFSLKNNLVSSFYSVDKSNKGSQIDTEDERKLPALAEMLSNRRKYTYDFCSYWCIKLSCCYRIRPKFFTPARIKA